MMKVPDCWMPYVNDSMKKLHNRFKLDTKFILTESDLKCWLFYELQNQKPYIPYAVHTEVTHYAKHTNHKNKLETKYKFRDLSLLTPSAIIDNENFINEGGYKKDILKKGFKHKAPAIHFELKFIRQGNNLTSLENDIKKLNKYYPDPETANRKFVLIWGSRSSHESIDNLIKELEKCISELENKSLDSLLDFYLFDKESLKHFSWIENKLK
jgi:hypothetical protein